MSLVLLYSVHRLLFPMFTNLFSEAPSPLPVCHWRTRVYSLGLLLTVHQMQQDRPHPTEVPVQSQGQDHQQRVSAAHDSCRLWKTPEPCTACFECLRFCSGPFRWAAAPKPGPPTSTGSSHPRHHGVGVALPRVCHVPPVITATDWPGGLGNK